MSTTDTARCEREGLTPDGEGLIVDCTIHGEIGRVQAGHHEAERGDALLTRHRADTERDERLRGVVERAVHGWWADEIEYADLPAVLVERIGKFVAAEVSRLDAVVTAVRELHKPEAWEDDLEGTSGVACSTCVDGNREAITYPCPTVRALDGGAR